MLCSFVIPSEIPADATDARHNNAVTQLGRVAQSSAWALEGWGEPAGTGLAPARPGLSPTGSWLCLCPAAVLLRQPFTMGHGTTEHWLQVLPQRERVFCSHPSARKPRAWQEVCRPALRFWGRRCCIRCICTGGCHRGMGRAVLWMFLPVLSMRAAFALLWLGAAPNIMGRLCGQPMLWLQNQTGNLSAAPVSFPMQAGFGSERPEQIIHSESFIRRT